MISRLDYCNSLLYNISESQLDKLQRVQNAAARLVAKCSKYESITPVLKSLHWLKIRQRIKYKILTLTFKILNDGKPVYLRDMLHYSQKSVNLRSNNQYKLVEPRYKLESCGARCFNVYAPRLWNKLPLYLKTCVTLETFKKQLKTVLIKECYVLS